MVTSLCTFDAVRQTRHARAESEAGQLLKRRSFENGSLRISVLIKLHVLDTLHKSKMIKLVLGSFRLRVVVFEDTTNTRDYDRGGQREAILPVQDDRNQFGQLQSVDRREWQQVDRIHFV